MKNSTVNNKTVLVIDDLKDIRDMLCQFLETKGYRSLQADNGKTGLELMLTEKPDLVLLDIGMPGLGGLSVLEQVEQSFADRPATGVPTTISSWSQYRMSRTCSPASKVMKRVLPQRAPSDSRATASPGSSRLRQIAPRELRTAGRGRSVGKRSCGSSSSSASHQRRSAPWISRDPAARCDLA